MDRKKTFTWEELSCLNLERNAHVAVRGKVYDVSKFLERHPGGRDVLLMAAGRDVTVLFQSYHIFSDISSKVLEKHYVGDLVSDELPTFPEPGPFFETAKQRIRQYFKETKQDPKYSPWMMLRYFLVPFFILLGWSAQLFWLSHSFLMSCFAAAFMGWCCALLGQIHLHDASAKLNNFTEKPYATLFCDVMLTVYFFSHFSVTSNPLMWKVVGAFHDFLNGSSYYVWIYQHVLGHHPYTNIDPVDPDIVTSPDDKDFRRIKWTQQWLPRYVYQHIYVPLVYCFLGVKTRYQDVAILFFIKKNGVIRLNPPSTSSLTLFVTGKIFFVFHRVVLPCMLLSVWKTVVLFIIADLAASYWLAVTFQCSHVVSEVDWPTPDEKGKISQDWAELQIQTTQDYATDKWFWNVFTGALNHQTTHHLFPGISQFYYPQITPIIKKTCQEFGVRYNFKETFPQALAAHVLHLKRLGQATEQHRAGTRQPGA